MGQFGIIFKVLFFFPRKGAYAKIVYVICFCNVNKIYHLQFGILAYIARYNLTFLQLAYMAWNWRETGVKLKWNWRETGVKLTWSWRETGVKLTWNWRETGVKPAWNWRFLPIWNACILFYNNRNFIIILVIAMNNNHHEKRAKTRMEFF